MTRLQISFEIGVQKIWPFIDSRLVVNQINGTFEAKEARVIKYLEKMRELVKWFQSIGITQIPRSKNNEADALSKLFVLVFDHLSKEVLVEVLHKKIIEDNSKEEMEINEETGLWMVPMKQYLQTGVLPTNEKDAQKVRVNAANYTIYKGRLYRNGCSTSWLKYLTLEEAK